MGLAQFAACGAKPSGDILRTTKIFDVLQLGRIRNMFLLFK
jgi:hypothetical protein